MSHNFTKKTFTSGLKSGKKKIKTHNVKKVIALTGSMIKPNGGVFIARC